MQNYIKDRCKYTLPLDEWGEVVNVSHTNYEDKKYEERINKYLSSLIVNEEEKELKRLLFNLRTIRNIAKYADLSIIDKYAYSSSAMKALDDIHKKGSIADNSRIIKYDFSEEAILEAMKSRIVFEEALTTFKGDIDGGAVRTTNHINYNRYLVVVYMRDKQIHPDWTIYFTDGTDYVVNNIYEGFVYDSFPKEEL
ncbi:MULTISPECIES: hypothetical protein [Enterobacter cloacae complex]|uniref:hypothetical protein n=1 Tax=Enterobacter cloacae complex TaxID=354276 RepID=UPI001012313C|nr:MULTISPECIES: hypothetical protein [Enterobacter cloacae complex]MDQ6584434.1 hypothetical protein [Enterobacter hormaechei]RYA41453.1 hypothetical protein DD603_13090 [Enterobacter cloacae complex sp. 2DZ2F2B]RYA45735.1 hypothetical protein DD605_06410 [Enterobacter cloacae complex sp. 3DZ3S2B]